MTILSYFLKLAPGVVLGIEAVQGDKASGASKKQMATDALNVATSTALGALTGTNAALASAASAIASSVIDATVVATKANGSYAAATSASTTTVPASSAPVAASEPAA